MSFYPSNPIQIRIGRLFLVLLTCAVYHRVASYDFVNFDDNLFVVNNHFVNGGITWEGIQWAFSGLFFFHPNHTPIWAPMMFLSHMLDFELWGSQPAGHHLTNLLIHLFNTQLVYLIARKLLQHAAKAFWISVLFAIHPLNVESVAWVVERKGLLSTFFVLCVILIFIRERPSLKTYFYSFVLFLLALMSKVTVAALPLFLFFLNRLFHQGNSSFRLNRTDLKSFCYLSPLFLLALLFSIQSLFYMKGMGTLISDVNLPWTTRISHAITSVLIYWKKIVWPEKLTVFYPYPEHATPFLTGTFCLVILLTLTLVLWKYGGIQSSTRIGWLWFFIMILPVIGLIQAGSQAGADRYTYLPHIGIFITIASLPFPFPRVKRWILPFLLVSTSCMSWASYRQASYWKNSITLFKHALEVDPDNYVAHNNLGIAYMEKDQWKEAGVEFQKALQLRPYFAKPYFNLGLVAKHNGNREASIHYFNQSIEISPGLSGAHFQLGLFDFESQRLNEAMRHFRDALQSDPQYQPALYFLGVALRIQGHYPEAIDTLSQALVIVPDSDTLYHIGMCYIEAGDTGAGIRFLKLSLELTPNHQPTIDVLQHLNAVNP